MSGAAEAPRSGLSAITASVGPDAKFLPAGAMGEVPFMDRIFIGPDTPEKLTVYAGEELILDGTFAIESVNRSASRLKRRQETS